MQAIVLTNTISDMTIKKKRFLKIIISVASVQIISFAALLAYSFVSIINPEKVRKRIVEELAPYCTSNGYLYFDYDSWTIKDGPFDAFNDFRFATRRAFSDVVDFRRHSPFLYTKDYIYYCGIEKTNENKEKACIYKANYDFSSISRVKIIKESERLNTLKASFGFDNYGYFYSDGEYFTFDFTNEKLTAIYDDDKKKLVDTGEYLRELSIEETKCKKSKNICSFSYNNEIFTFDESNIDKTILSLLSKYKFKPSWQISFPSGLSSIVYYGNEGYFSSADCIVITINRNLDIVCDYQLFTSVTTIMDYAYLFPQIELA